jgi:hypothetical protein
MDDKFSDRIAAALPTLGARIDSSSQRLNGAPRRSGASFSASAAHRPSDLPLALTA